MTRITFYALALASTMLVAACTKDGVYRPKEKISQVLEKSSYTASHFDGEAWQTDTTVHIGKHMVEQWFWDGDYLQAIAYYDKTGRVESTVRFEYDGRQLIKAAAGANDYLELTYDGRKLTEAKSYHNGQVVGLYTVTHDGSTISEIEVSYPSTSLKGSDSPAHRHVVNAFWQFVMPCGAPLSFGRTQAKAALSYTLSLSWDGKNISRIEKKYNGQTNTIEYSYDDKYNPYCGFLFSAFEEGEIPSLAKNNVLTEKYTDADGNSELTTYSYAYDGKWPIARGTGWQLATDAFKASRTQVLYFEYAE